MEGGVREGKERRRKEGKRRTYVALTIEA